MKTHLIASSSNKNFIGTKINETDDLVEMFSECSDFFEKESFLIVFLDEKGFVLYVVSAEIGDPEFFTYQLLREIIQWLTVLNAYQVVFIRTTKKLKSLKSTDGLIAWSLESFQEALDFSLSSYLIMNIDNDKISYISITGKEIYAVEK